MRSDVDYGGWLDGHWMQVPYQLTNTVAAFSLSFCVSWPVLFVMNKIKFLRVHVSKEEEEAGIDDAQVGVQCYEFLNTTKPLMDESKKIISNENGIHHNENGNEVFSMNGDTPRCFKPLKHNWIMK